MAAGNELAEVLDAVQSLRREVARLGERITALETGSGPQSAPPAASSAGPSLAGVNEETLMVISAAIAAFLGKKAPIRQIRLIGSAAWSQQGRVTIQASHALPQAGRSET